MPIALAPMRIEIAQRLGEQSAVERRALARRDQRLVGVDDHDDALVLRDLLGERYGCASRRARARPRRSTGMSQLKPGQQHAQRTSSSAVIASRRRAAASQAAPAARDVS